MKYSFKIFVLSTSILLISNKTTAQKNTIQKIDSIVKAAHGIGVLNGNVLVARNNKIIYKSSFGYNDASKTKKLNDHDRFSIGSITKEFSAVALLQLEELGKLKLEDKVSKFIPELGTWANEVSIKNLLQYTSGIPNVNWKSIKGDADLFDGLMAVKSLDFKPGTNYDYNNNNIFLRHFLVERISGMPYKSYLEKFIFKPCDMNSTIVTPFGDLKNIARGFSITSIADQPDLPITGLAYVTTSDLLKWSKCLHSKTLINKNSLFELGEQFNLPDTQSALGRAVYKDENLVEHSHHGRSGNFEAILVSDIKEQLTIILLTNNYHGKVFEISDSIKGIIKDQKPTTSKN